MQGLQDGTNILVAGASGFVGARTMQKYPQAIPLPSDLVRGAGEELKRFVVHAKPRAIINAAAISDIGECEKNPDASYLANVQLPIALAQAAEEIGAKLISFSSDQVYTGCETVGPYREDEELPLPKNVYARHKLQAEKEVLAINPTAVLLRATWMYDMPLYAHKNRGNFLVNILQAVLKGERVAFFDCVYRGITYVRQVVELLDEAVDLEGGVYNYGSENPLTAYQTARALFDALGVANLKDTLIGKAVAEAGKAPHNLWINCDKLTKQGICFDTTAEGFERCVRDYFLK